MVDLQIILQGLVILILIYIVVKLRSGKENLCVSAPYGYIDSDPYSTYVNANMALTNSTSIGQAPLGAPIGFLPGGSPITQGQYGIYQGQPLTLDQVDNYDRNLLLPAAEALPIYTEPGLPSQCTPVW
jgi:hypothetical protein